MRRPLTIWASFAAALVVVLAVMGFLSVKMLRFERSMAEAQAQAVLEENVRLALWRMDSMAVRLSRELAGAEGPFQQVEDGQRVEPDSESSGGSKANAADGASPTPPPLPTPSQRPVQQMQVAQQFGQQELNLRNEAANQQRLSVQEYEQRSMVNRVAVPVDWKALEPVLLATVQDILPGATLESLGKGESADGDTRRLAAIPARLVVPEGARPSAELPWNTPLRVSLMLAWGCLVVAAGAVGLLLGATLGLSERRGAFASAVTHELRTPLTTFRMYAELLSTGRIAGERERKEYLDTLVSESDRLGHMIENVMAYSRLEKRVSARVLEDLPVGEVIDRAGPSLRRRAEQAGMELVVRVGEEAWKKQVRVDAVAVQQVLLNLVDNACKYGKGPIEVEVLEAEDMAGRAARRLEIVVSDRGPGVSAEKAAKLFRAFDKASDDAVPGIGLGLYLSRQLMREMGGELRYGPRGEGRGRFVVEVGV